jgi:hypothetical protein
MINKDANILHDSAQPFFESSARVNMMFTPRAAVDICIEAAEHGLVVARLEGGIYRAPLEGAICRAPTFEARLDCIWDGADPPLDSEAAKDNNMKATQFIRSEMGLHNAFIILALPLTVW